MSSLGQLTCKLDGTVVQASGELKAGGEEVAAQFVAMMRDAAMVIDNLGGLKQLSVVMEGAQYNAHMTGDGEIVVTKDRRGK